MRFVENVELVLQLSRRQACLFPNIPNFVDTIVRSGIQLDDVELPPFLNCQARIADRAGLAVDHIRTVDCLGENTCRRRLPDAAWTAKEVRVGDPPSLHRVAKCLRYRRLPDEIPEFLGPPLSIERGGGHLVPGLRHSSRAGAFHHELVNLILTWERRLSAMAGRRERPGRRGIHQGLFGRSATCEAYREPGGERIAGGSGIDRSYREWLNPSRGAFRNVNCPFASKCNHHISSSELDQKLSRECRTFNVVDHQT